MNRIETWAKNILRSDAVIIDTETTGLDATAQIIQICIIDMQGNVLFNSLLRPSCQIHATATATHGMTARHLSGAPTIVDVIEQIKESLGDSVIIYNAAFDTRMLRQTLDAFKLDSTWLNQISFQCAMKMYSESLGTTKYQKLEGGDHSALGDCLATLNLLRRMAGPESPMEEPVKRAARDILLVFAPPQRLREWLRATFDARKAKGKPPPPEFEHWLQTWQQVLNDLPTVADGLTDSENEELWRVLEPHVKVREVGQTEQQRRDQLVLTGMQNAMKERRRYD